jgi:hypothetical protein
MADKKKPQKQEQTPKAASQPANEGVAALEFDEKPAAAVTSEGKTEGDNLAGSEGLKALSALDALLTALVTQLKPLLKKTATNVCTQIVLKYKDWNVKEGLGGYLLPGLDDTVRQAADFTEKLQKEETLAPVREAFEAVLGKLKPHVSLLGEAEAQSHDEFSFVLTLDLKKLAA